jgi:tetratricopeptide (TPR) repeat protein
MSLLRLAAGAFALGAATLAVPALRAQAPGGLDAAIRTAYQAAYNLDLPAAAAAMREAVGAHPANPRTHRALATMLWLTILFERGAVTIDHYIGGISSKRFSLPPPSPALAAEFRQALARAIDLSEAQLERDPGDLDARDELGKAYALQASYVASIEGSMTGALRSARRAFDAQETILERDPRRADAGVIVGLYRYVVSTMALPSRLFAYVIGMGGGKERGISLLEEAARPPHALVEAQAALVLIFAKEKRHLEGLEIMRQLATQYPRNRIFVMEVGAAALRAERYADADATLTRGLAAFDADARPKIPGELALWLYKRGQARLGMKQPPAAAADFERALASSPMPWTAGRLHLALGKVHDLAGRRKEALAKYLLARRIAEQIDDPPAAAEANRLLRTPYRP